MEVVLFVTSQVRFWHWTAATYAQHKALGDLYDILSEKGDELVEVVMGEPDDNTVRECTLQLAAKTTAPIQDLDTIANVIRALPGPQHVQNIRDEMVAAIRRCQYRLTLL
jgi:hypothetical protein